MSQNTLILNVEGINSQLQINRPKFENLWESYKEVNKIASEVYKIIGGNVYENYIHGQKIGSNAFENACALRMSRAFNYGNFKIPSGVSIIPNPNDISRWRGKDGFAYIFRVNDIIKFIELSFKKPEYKIKTNGVNKRNEIVNVNKKGIIIFKVKNWSNASGHVTLLDGNSCADGHSYFTHNLIEGIPKDKQPITTEILLWELK